MVIAVFGTGGTARLGPFVAADAKARLCATSGAGVVSGSDFAVLAQSLSQAKLIARVVGGSVPTPSRRPHGR